MGEIDMVIALVALASAYLLLLAGKSALAWHYKRRSPEPGVRTEFSDVTILQPVLGGDPALLEALATNVEVLAGARFIWLLDDGDHVGWKTCRFIAAKFPGANIQLVATPHVPQSVNPKIFKLARGEDLVTTPFVVVLDDDTRLTREGLCALIDGLRDHDVSTALPLYRPEGNGPTQLVAQFVNNQSIVTYLPLLVFAPAITLNGMCYAFRTHRLCELGGFDPLARRLTDDLAVARLVRDAGGKIRQTDVPLEISTTVADWRSYLRVMHRWFVFATLQVRAQPLAWRFVLLALHGIPPLLLWATLAYAVKVSLVRGDWIAAGIAAAMIEGRHGILVATQRIFCREPRHSFFWSIVSELLLPFHLAHALVWRRICWRTRVIDVRADGDFSFVK